MRESVNHIDVFEYVALLRLHIISMRVLAEECRRI